MPAKRQSAFNRALREAQTAPEITREPEIVTEEHREVETQELALPMARVAEQVASPEEPPARSKGGRPRNPVPKKKFTYYLKEDTDTTVASIKKSLVRHADILVDDKGEVVDQALALMRFSLEDAQSRAIFLSLYQRWRENGAN